MNNEMHSEKAANAPMWWDGGDRAITAREKATIEEHGPSCYAIPLVPAQAVDPADPWRGLYLPARMPEPSEYGDLTHPDMPLWPDDREDALDKVVHAQGFDFHIVAGDFTEVAMEDGDELYWEELRAWNPEAPEGEWRLAWKGDTEDGRYAWFVRPMALRPEPAALAARQPVVQEPVAWFTWTRNRMSRRISEDRQDLAQRAAKENADMDQRGVSECYRIEGPFPLYDAPPAQGIDLGQFRDRIKAAIDRIVNHQCLMRIPVDNTDPDIVLADILHLIEGQRDAASGVGNG